jgi:hypothetical protein
MAGQAGPTALRSGKDDRPPKVGETLFQPLQLRLENDIPLRAHAVKEGRSRIQTKVIDVPEYRHYGRDPAAGGEKNNVFVRILVEAKSARRSRCLDCQADCGAFVQERRNTTLGLFFDGDFDKARLRRR